jgi:hypothetical protein
MRNSKCSFIFATALFMLLFCTSEVLPQPIISVDPAYWNFSNVGVNCKLTKSFRISNGGDEPLQISNISLRYNTGVFTLSGVSSINLPPGTFTTNVTITFSPRFATIESEELRIVSNAQTSPTIVFLIGDGYGTECSPQAGSLQYSLENNDFGDVIIGWPEWKVVLLTAVDGSVTLNEIITESSSCPGAFRWRLLRPLSVPPEFLELPYTLVPDIFLGLPLQVIFDPEKEGECNDSLITIKTDSEDTPIVTIPIQGSGACFGVPPQSFEDVPCSHWAFHSIMSLYYATPRITSGCSPEGEVPRYCPDDNVTREQMAAFIIRALVVNGDLEAEPPADYCGTINPFTDVSYDRWSCKYIKKLQERGLASGYGDGRFGPIDLVTREQMAAFLTRSLDEVPADGYCGTSSPFTDVSYYRWSCKYVKKLVELRITLGYGGGLYGPDDPVTRAQMAVFLKRAFLQDYLPE